MNILFTCCGRAGSKGFKNKNLKMFLETPLVYYTIAAIKLYIDKYDDGRKIDVVLNTDSEDLITLVAKQTAVNVEIIRREENLGGDAVPKVSVIRDCLVQMQERKGYLYDVVVDLDITSPLRTLADVKNAVDKKLSRQDTDVVYSVTGSRRNPYFNMVKEEEGFFVKAIAADFTARQQAPVFYDMNASIYAYSPEALINKEPKDFFNYNCDAIMMADTAVLDIDSEEDYGLMQVIAEYLIKKNDGIREVKDMADKMNVS